MLFMPAHHRAATHGYVMEHIVVWEHTHGQQVPEGYVIHHLNGVKDDNRPENLEVFESHSAHMKEHYPKGAPVADRWNKA